tara:strand:- start:2330 stop:3136 length:807 start_codon:yes stop_codon:yes gene_type:complete
MQKFKNLIHSILKIFNLKIVKNDFFVDLDNSKKNFEHNFNRYEFIFNNSRIKDPGKLFSLVEDSKSQLFQDLFVLNEIDYLNKGFFIEIGAANGIDLSNTYLLEKKFNWDGVVVEPAKIWEKEISKNRSCTVSYDCIYSETGLKVEFLETTKPEFSSLNIDNKSKDIHENYRIKNNKKYELSTLSFSDFASKYNIPKEIHYLSVDTEGTELEIIKSINLNDFDIKIITIEHNFTEKREAIYSYLNNQNYKRVLEKFSLVDDWYVKTYE